MLTSIGDLHIHHVPGWIAAIGLSIFFVALVVRRSLTALDAVLLLSAGTYGAAVTATRIAAGAASGDDLRFGMVAAGFVIPVVFAHVPTPDRRRAVLLSSATLLLATANTYSRYQARASWEQAGRDREALLVAVATLVRAGEPMVEDRRLNLPVFGSGLDQTLLREVASAGLGEKEEPQEAWRRRARGELRTHVWPSGTVAGPPPAVHDRGFVSESGCVGLGQREQVTVEIVGASTISVAASSEDELVLHWVDSFGVGQRPLPRSVLQHPFRPGYVTVALAEPPEGGAELTIEVVSAVDDVAVCGLASSRSATATRAGRPRDVSTAGA